MEVGYSLARLNRAIAELEKAREGCEFNQSYFLHREISEVESAEHDYIEALKTALGICGSDNP